jgi:hypothetical protein
MQLLTNASQGGEGLLSVKHVADVGRAQVGERDHSLHEADARSGLGDPFDLTNFVPGSQVELNVDRLFYPVGSSIARELVDRVVPLKL